MPAKQQRKRVKRVLKKRWPWVRSSRIQIVMVVDMGAKIEHGGYSRVPSADMAETKGLSLGR
jgi:hypothetical protein